jgi:cell division protein FtsL
MTRRAWAIGLFVAIALIIALYRAKYGARESMAEKAALKAEIASIEAEIRVLRNEFAHLSRPEWIAEYARKELGMGPPRPDQVMTVDELAEKSREVPGE